MSVRIPEHKTTAIVGPSGGGKTTLCHLIARFWDVDKGSITLGGEGVRNYSMDSLMKNFSFVFQNVYLFQSTIADNIRFGRQDAPMERVIEAAKKACCHDFIMALPDGYETVIGEGGATLSGGEKQRISIARAIMKDAPVIILDEATANVDPENERELMEAVDALTKEKTIVIIDAFYCAGAMEISPVWSVSSMPARGPSRYSTIRPPSSSISRASASVLRES